MSSRFYDYIIQVSGNTFYSSNSLLGSNSNAFAEIVSVEGSNLKVKVSNAAHFFEIGEVVFSNSTPINTYSESTTYTSTGIVVYGNTYAIDGSTNTFSLPISADYKKEIQVYANNILVSENLYEFPSTTLGTIGVDFNNIQAIVFETANDEIATSTEAVFPQSDLDSLEIRVDRGIPSSFHFIAANTPPEQTTIEVDTVSDIFPSNYVALKNAFEQEPVVSLYTIYYPGEWYPTNNNGNPTNEGAGYPWPHPFPLRYAQVFGDDLNIPDYSIEHENNNYVAYPITRPGITLSADGSLGEVNLILDNTGYEFSALVENAKLVGNNSTSADTATVNGELVTNIDYRTNPTHVSYDAAVATARGGINLAFDYASTTSLGDTWATILHDSRDLLGAVVEIKSMYASSLEYWPEYGVVNSISSNIFTMSDSSPYRVGDEVKGNNNAALGTIARIANNDVIISQASLTGLSTGDRLYIKNENYDPYGYLDHKLVVTKMVSYNETSVVFNLSERTSTLIDELPKRKFYKNTCPWKYKGVYCKYPQNGNGIISNTFPVRLANGMFTVSNATTLDGAQDRCSKTVLACKLRNNLQNFGGFPGTNEKL